MNSAKKTAYTSAPRTLFPRGTLNLREPRLATGANVISNEPKVPVLTPKTPKLTLKVEKQPRLSPEHVAQLPTRHLRKLGMAI